MAFKRKVTQYFGWQPKYMRQSPLAIVSFFVSFISTRHTCDATINDALLTGLPGSNLSNFVNAIKWESTVTATRCNFRRSDILADAVLFERPRWALVCGRLNGELG